jgi:hypothetical protein
MPVPVVDAYPFGRAPEVEPLRAPSSLGMSWLCIWSGSIACGSILGTTAFLGSCEPPVSSIDGRLGAPPHEPGETGFDPSPTAMPGSLADRVGQAKRMMLMPPMTKQ